MMTGRLILLSGLAALAFALPACNREVEEPEVVFVDPRVARIDRLDIGRSPGGWIVTAHVRDQRGMVEALTFDEVDSQAGVKVYDLVRTDTERLAPGLGDLSSQTGVAAIFIRDAELEGVASIEVRAEGGSSIVVVPQRAIVE